MHYRWIISLTFAFIWIDTPNLVDAKDTIVHPLSTESTQQKLDDLEHKYEEQNREIKELKREIKQQRRGAFSSAIARFNPKIALNGLFTAAGFSDDEPLNFGAHDPKENGFNVQALELNFRGAIDPYFSAQFNLNTLIEEGETIVELEEGFLTTQALPYNVQLMGGQFFTRFGNMNHIHAHDWDFVDQPIILNRLLGPDGLRGPGLQASWLAPTPFYLEFIGSAQQARGEIASSFLGKEGETVGGHILDKRAINDPNDLLYMPRVVSAFDFTDAMTLKVGGSALLGPNSSSPDARTHIYGADMKLKWQPRRTMMGYPFVSWESEIIYRDHEAGANKENAILEETLEDWGLYSQIIYGFKPRWVAGLRFEYADGHGGIDQINDDLRNERYRLSPNISWGTSEFSRLRLQYNLDFAESRGHEVLHGFFLQWSFALGEHGAHQF
ncbi:MAG: hypothetical protein CMH81_05500 [Nitrospiraceae bacterium]|nr:hypothetical protein [Nitrospiraceae bacterium]|tara:strand:+ start:471 stop:1793 length:1323 start_codon:yes stop_codon:yes gene_type:complete